MKNLLLILLLANILYFIWGLATDEEQKDGVVVVDEADLGPPLEIASNPETDAVVSVGAVLGSGEPSELDAVVGRSCVSVGPFLGDLDADSAVLEYSNEGMRTSRRTIREDTFVGHWVQISDIADDATAKGLVATLHAGGLTDAYKTVTEDEGIKISLGLFGDINGAEKIELQARSLGVPAEVKPRLEDRKVYYADIALPPGKGAGAMIEKYGSERVLFREAATCPK